MDIDWQQTECAEIAPFVGKLIKAKLSPYLCSLCAAVLGWATQRPTRARMVPDLLQQLAHYCCCWPTWWLFFGRSTGNCEINLHTSSLVCLLCCRFLVIVADDEVEHQSQQQQQCCSRPFWMQMSGLINALFKLVAAYCKAKEGRKSEKVCWASLKLKKCPTWLRFGCT